MKLFLVAKIFLTDWRYWPTRLAICSAATTKATHHACHSADRFCFAPCLAGYSLGREAVCC